MKLVEKRLLQLPALPAPENSEVMTHPLAPFLVSSVFHLGYSAVPINTSASFFPLLYCIKQSPAGVSPHNLEV